MLTFGLVLSWSIVSAEEGFYVIPVKKQNYAPVPKTGQTTFRATGGDGNLQKGVAWPNPRFTDNGNGTVTDNLTGLVWLKYATCTAFSSGDSTGQNSRNWNNALTAANSLEFGYCGLTDVSVAGDWRLPNLRELQSLIHYGEFDFPSVPNTAGTGKWTEGDPFTSLTPCMYWSSTTNGTVIVRAWYVNFIAGRVDYDNKVDIHCVWPVRENGGPNVPIP